MLQTTTGTETDETRYDPETLRKVIALAGKLQERHQETLTAAQIESVGGEVGLDAQFIRQALTQLSARKSISGSSTHSKAEFNSLICALAFPLVYGPVAYLMRHSPDAMTIFSQILPAPLAGILGFITGKKKVGFLAGIALALSLTPIFAESIPGFFRDGPYCIILPLLGGWLGSLGATIRETYSPLPSADPADKITQPEVLQLIVSMQAELERRKQSGS
jgi:hypothetical protein